MGDDGGLWTLPRAEFDAVRGALAKVRQGLLAGEDERVEHLEPLLRWLNDDAPLAVPPGAPVAPASRAARLWALQQHLQQYQEDAKALGDVVGAALKHASGVSFFARSGLPNEARLFSEVFDRVARKILPTPADDGELAVVLRRALVDRAFLREAPDGVVVSFVAFLERHSPALQQGLEKVERDLRDAVALLAVRVATGGTAADVRARAGLTGELEDSPFLDLPRWTDLVLERRATGPDADKERREQLSGARTCLRACHALLEKARTSLLHSSVSVDLVFRLDLAERQVQRLLRLIDLLDPAAPERPSLVVQTVRELLDAGEHDTSLYALFDENTRLLARRIVESAGQSGEHYIASSGSEYRQMWRSAAVGGAFMAVVCLIKFGLTWAKLPPFFAGLSHGLNYASAFVIMQLCHLTLATKQPSATAAALAAALDEKHGHGGTARLVDLIGRTARTQVAAIGGNIGAIIPVVVVLHFAILAVTGKPFLDAKDAAYAIASHDPHASLSIVFAAMTGVFLWLCSVASGWMDNWLRYRRIAEAFATNRRFRRVLGVNTAEALGRFVDRHAGGVFGCAFFGLLLGLTPVVSSFFGLGLEVRHITLSTATVLLGALAELHRGTLASSEVGWAMAGLCSIALMNFAVSFALALSVALRARDVDMRAFRALVAATLRTFGRRPWLLIVPIKDEAAVAAPAPAPAPASAPAPMGPLPTGFGAAPADPVSTSESR